MPATLSGEASVSDDPVTCQPRHPFVNFRARLLSEPPNRLHMSDRSADLIRTPFSAGVLTLAP